MYKVAVLATALALVACGEPTASVGDICNTMLDGDAQAIADIRREGIDPAEMCACIGVTVDAMADNKKAAQIGVFKSVTAIRAAKGIGVDEAVFELGDELRAGTGSYAFTEDDFDYTPELIVGVMNQLEDGGTCKAG